MTEPSKKTPLRVIEGGASRKSPGPPSETIVVLRLSRLATASPKLTSEVGTTFAQAATVVLEQMGLRAPIRMVAKVRRRTRAFDIQPLLVTEAMRSTHAELGRATEEGAYAIAILLAREVDGLVVTSRAKIGEGVDWWLTSNPDQPFTHRLEVSGTTQDRPGVVAARVTVKDRQSKRSDASKVPAIVVVVDFRAPKAVYKERR